MSILLELVQTLVMFAAIIIFTFSIFKIPIKENDRQISVIALTVGTTNFYFKFVIDSPYFLLAQMVVWIVLMVLLRKYPILYSMIVCITGAIFISFIDGIATITAVGLNISTMDKILNNARHYAILHIIVTALYLLLARLLVRFNIGFSFVRRRFAGTSVLKTYNFIWAAALIFVVALLQINANSYNAKSFNFYLIIVMTIIMIVSVYNAFVKNKESIADRFDLEGDGTNKHS